MALPNVGAVMAVGGGVAGIQAALDIAESGLYVYLVESSPAIGGVMAQLDKTFPTNDCSMCILSPKLVESARHGNIELVTNASVEALEGTAGNFKVKVKVEPRYVKVDNCVGCGVCADKCPVKVPDKFNGKLSYRKAIYTKYARAVPSAYAIDRESCLYLTRGKEKGKDVCMLCAKHCDRNAIDFEQVVTTREIRVGSIILSPGFEAFDLGGMENYGYGIFPNVMTSLEFERVLSASGPTGGHLKRPYDGGVPCKIAWIQCVGSNSANAYCSCVCCTYALKEAIVAKEHLKGDLEATIFYLDMRTFGKDFERYLEKVRYQFGVRLVRSRIFKLEENEKRNILIRYAEMSGEITTEEFDLVVLSVGLTPAKETAGLVKKLGVKVNKYGFCQYPNFNPVSTSREGIYACGALRELPYDRACTSISSFPMCESCAREYSDPGNRRFHAQPVACPRCGPNVFLADGEGNRVKGGWDKQARWLLAQGNILAVKGLGGFHLACDGTDREAISRLRRRKRRPDKPLAIMCRDLKTVRKYCRISPEEEELLRSPAAPIVILEKKRCPGLPPELSPGLNSVGVMLPYTPLHLLLMAEGSEVLVMTSGNTSGLPLVTDNTHALTQLKKNGGLLSFP